MVYLIFMNTPRQEKIKDMICNIEQCKDIDNFFDNLRILGKKLKTNEFINNQIKILNIFANKERLMIIYSLMEKDRCVCELEAILDKSQPSISHHLKRLEDVNLIRGWKKSKFTYYSLNKSQLKSYINDYISFFDYGKVIL
ncbi:MAG: winged helix-turn-helix transcriptional regulator [Candidatus Lokiarchaeota archaeon]|nr:winged helix-turn-helix transcriptional regulator [Candidatus Lokiarchaeota archaeon]